MSSYHNAVSDKLVVFLYPTCSVFTVFSKDNILKFSSDNGSSSMLPIELQGAIFSTTDTISVAARATLTPLADESYSSYFQANFGQAHQELKYQSTNDFTIVYEATPVTKELLHEVVNPQEHSDIHLMHTYAAAMRYENAIYYWLYNDTVSLLVWKEGRLVLTNRYKSDTKDEVFYYIMLAVEQLELHADKLHFGFVGSKAEHAVYQVMFQNYLPPLHLCSTGSSTDIDELAQFFAECVL